MRRGRRWVSRIGARVLLFNVLIVFLPVLSLLLLDTYEEQLLDALERSLVQQGRVLAAALSVQEAVDQEAATALLAALRGQHEARLRILDASGALLSDSSSLPAAGAPGAPVDTQPVPPAGTSETAVARTPPQTAGARESLLYRLGSFPVRLLRDVTSSPAPPLPSADFYTRAPYASGSEVRAALAGRYGAATRVSAGGQISVTLYSALPIVRADGVAGVVLVSQSTFRILQDLYRLRVDVFTIFLWSLGAAVVLSAFLALTIARPIAVLEERARQVVDEHGRLTAPLPRGRRRDEIGRLTSSLAELTEQMDRYTRRLEGFAADASHELKNPLASIAAHCEMAQTAPDDTRRERHLRQARADVRRAEEIITAMRELSHIDARTEPRGQCTLANAVRVSVQEIAGSRPGMNVSLDVDLVGAAEVPVSSERLHQILVNLLDNARGFAPSGSTITVSAHREATGDGVELAVRDEGPGLEEPNRVFARFYSARPERNGHLGLGLSIVQAIAESVGGSARAANRTDRPGAVVTVRLPVI